MRIVGGGPSGAGALLAAAARTLCGVLYLSCRFCRPGHAHRIRPNGLDYRRLLRAAALPKRLADGLEDGRRNRQASISFVDPFDDRPRRLHRAGPLQSALGGRDELVVHPPVLPLPLGHAPARQRILLELAQMLLLSVLPQVHPELEDQRTVVGERPLEAADAIELLVELRAAVAAIDTIEKRTRVPRAEEQAEAALPGEVAPVAPVLGTLALFIGRLAICACDDPARIHPLVQQIDGFSFACTVDSLEDDDDREPCVRQLPLRFEQLYPQRGNPRLVVLFGDRSSKFRRFEHYFFPAIRRTASTVARFTSSTEPVPGTVTSSLMSR